MSGSQSSGSGQFHVSNAQIYDPNGNIYLAHGINLGPDNTANATASQLQSFFPGINFVRFATTIDYPNTSVAQEEAYITSLTSKGIVVEVEDHPYPSPGTYTGSQLSSESAWYSQLATDFLHNPYVWFGTMNEPNSGSYGSSEAAISTQEAATYNAIRATGNNTMVMMELYGGGNPGTIGAGFGMTPSTYANMTNIAWDLHYYGWSSNYSTDQTTVSNDLLGSASSGSGIAAAQTIKSADGTVPVIVGEFGNSTDGSNVDPNGNQVINAVLNSGYGYAAWAWGGSGVADSLTNGGTSLTSYGQAVAAGIVKSAASSASSTSSTGSTLTLDVAEDAWQGDAQFTVSVDSQPVGGTLTASALHGSGDSNVVALNGAWASGATHQVQVAFTNDAYGGSPSTDRNLYVNGLAFNGTAQANTTATLLGNGASSFTVGAGVAGASAPADTLTLHLAEDAWQGDAQFVLWLDGNVVSTPQSVTASHAAGAWQDVSFAGNFGAGAHTVGVQFTNDAYGGSPSADRNLYVNGLDLNGQHVGSGVTTLLSDGTANFAVSTTA